jgi:hypothetical protein
MIFRSTIIRHVFPWTWALLLTVASATEAASQLYRYRNAEGVVVVGFQIPVDLIRGGYEVLNLEGMVIKVVPRSLTDDERKAKDAEEKRDEAALAEQERLREWDESLMLRYSDVVDIEAAQKRGLGDLQIRVTILRGNRRALKQKVENYQKQAANLERSGMAVDVEQLRAIESLQDEIAITDRAIADRQEDFEEFAA